MITGSRFAGRVGEAGIEHVPLRGAADIDDRDLDSALPERRSKLGLAKLRFPLDQLLPHVSAMVTNCGYGGIHYALAYGVRPSNAGSDFIRLLRY